MNAAKNPEKVRRVYRENFPVTSFSLTRSQIEWIGKRASQMGIKKSEFVRDLLAEAMAKEESKAA